MIQINLSDKQALELMDATGWGNRLPDHIEKEIFRQIERQVYPAPTQAAELAVWKAESGHLAQIIENWKRKNETMGDL